MLPNLVIVGAEKCGTSALHFYLDRHPEVFMSQPKELRFFSQEWERGVEWYASHFAEARTPVAGEASPQYTSHPFRPHVPERMSSVIPDAKLVLLVRDPLDRILSSWLGKRAIGDFHPLAEAVRPSMDNEYVAKSAYATQLEQYLPYYDLDRILVLDQDDLLHRRRETLRRVFAFLGVDEAFDTPEFDTARHVTSNKRVMRLRGPLVPRRVAPSETGRIPHVVRARVKRTLLRPLSAPARWPELPPEDRAALDVLLRPEADRLRALTGEAFAGWSV